MSESDTNGDQRPAGEDPPYIDLVVGPNHESDNRNFGRMLAEFRELAGLSRSEAAARLDVSAEYLRLIELGRRTPAMAQMRTFIDAYGIPGELGKLQPGGDRPDLILFPPNTEEPVTVDFVSRIRETRRRSTHVPQKAQKKRNGLQPAEAELPSETRAVELGYIVSLLATADDRTLGKVYDLLQSSPAK
ncbi:helix-turn-helix domain-containing protein [Microbacterium wangruii]|uniref:helix-turn-helix domain-containing protein n=1 Tax=Microbacterium wangruii TaxID=3049073 RepID=UPI00256EB999|nr:helix-turn-helix transcriptional regulator [Microbacterium sp. zg-Y1211]MDL5486026.1 helix-turn-helix transcriptional regulator [Microbacterium sp. zg-Y1211]